MRLRPASFGFLLFLSALGAVLPLSIDMGLPALPAVGRSLGVLPAQAALTLSVFIAGFALVPVLFGPLSDHFGRRPILLAGSALFTVAGAACAAASSLTFLLTARFLQGAGAGVGAVLVLAIVRDVYEGPMARARLAYVRVVQTVAPMVAPTLGVWVLALAGWRAIYATLACAGLLLWIAVALTFEESRPTVRAVPFRPSAVLANYGKVLGERITLGYILVNAFTFAGMFAWITGSPLVMLEVLGLRPSAYGVVFALTAFGTMAGAFTSGRLNQRGIHPQRLLELGLTVAAAAAMGLLVLTATGTLSVAWLLPPLLCTTFATGIVAPNAAQGALEPLPQLAGATAAMLSFLQMLCASTASAMVSALFSSRSVLAMTGVMAVCAFSALSAYLLLARGTRNAVEAVG